jgi:hypothetical protein
MVKDASESLVWGVTKGLARGEYHLLARPRKIVMWQRHNLKGESKEKLEHDNRFFYGILRAR